MSLSCYGDFTNPAHAGWLEVCRENNGTAVMVFRNGNGKNGADIALTIGAMELVQNAAAKMIVIVSSDSDFAPLAQKITTAGCIAIGVGHDNASEDLRQAFDRYIILPATGPTKTTTQIPKAAASPMPEPPQRTTRPPTSAQPASQAESLLPRAGGVLVRIARAAGAQGPKRRGAAVLSRSIAAQGISDARRKTGQGPAPQGSPALRIGRGTGVRARASRSRHAAPPGAGSPEPAETFHHRFVLFAAAA